jgi:predicted dienelactone hydrolase
MRSIKSFLAVALCLTTTLAHAAGFRFIEVPADAHGPALKGAMWYPCAALPDWIQVGEFKLPGVKECPISGENLPLVVISHGRGGRFIGHHDTAETLADAGFVVAAIDHPGDTASDPSRTSELSVFVERPTDIKRLIDFMLAASPAAAKIDAQRVGFFGFSRGGYTGLVLIGAEPHFHERGWLCQQSPRLCAEVRAKPLTHDPRIKAAVIADPIAVFFNAGSYAAVKAQVQLWASAKGGDGVEPDSVSMVDKDLQPDEFHLVSNSSHFAFLMPCRPEMAKKLPPLCTDPGGFDRAAFHKEFNRRVLAFFRAKLGGR